MTSRNRDRLWSAWILGVVILASVLRLVEVQAVGSWLDRVLPFVPGR